MTSTTGEGGMTLIELALAGLLAGLLATTAWASVHTIAGRLVLSADASRLERALRRARDTAILQSQSMSVDTAAVSGRLTPSATQVRFYPDGTADVFSASAVRGGAFIAVSVEATGRIRVTHAPA